MLFFNQKWIELKKLRDQNNRKSIEMLKIGRKITKLVTDMINVWTRALVEFKFFPLHYKEYKLICISVEKNLEEREIVKLQRIYLVKQLYFFVRLLAVVVLFIVELTVHKFRNSFAIHWIVLGMEKTVHN